MYLCRRRFTTFSGTFTVWRDEERARAAFHAAASRGSRHGISGTGDARRRFESEVRVWIGGAGRYREEIVRDPCRAGTVIVVDGDRWWMDDPARGVLLHEGDDSHTVGTHDVDVHLDPFRVVPALHIGAIDEAEHAGRRCWRVHATVGRGGQPPTHPVHLTLLGSDELRLVVDRETGAALRVAHVANGAPFHVQEMTEFAFDPELPDELFAVAPPPGRPVHPTTDTAPAEAVSVEEAASAAPFRVLLPTELPAGIHHLEVRYQRAVPFFDSPALVTMSGFAAAGRRPFEIAQTATPGVEDEFTQWRTVHHDGETYDVAADADGAMVRTVRAGTSVRLGGPFDVEELLACAASLRPVDQG